MASDFLGQQTKVCHVLEPFVGLKIKESVGVTMWEIIAKKVSIGEFLHFLFVVNVLFVVFVLDFIVHDLLYITHLCIVLM